MTTFGKAKVEVGVQVVERWVLAKLRNRRFTSPSSNSLTSSIANHLGASRLELFHQIDRSALSPLPAEIHEYAEWKECRVGIDYLSACTRLAAKVGPAMPDLRRFAPADQYLDPEEQHRPAPARSGRRRRTDPTDRPSTTSISAVRPTSNNFQERMPMLLHPTQSQLDQLGLVGMAKAFKELVENPEAKTLDPKLPWGRMAWPPARS